MKYGSSPKYGFAPGFEYLEEDCVLYLPCNGPEPFEIDTTGNFNGFPGIQPDTVANCVTFRPGMEYLGGRHKAYQSIDSSTNQVLNPVGGIAGNIAALGAAAIQVPSMLKGYTWNTSTKLDTTAAVNDGISYTLNALANLDHYCTVYLDTPWTTQQWSVDGIAWVSPTYMCEVPGGWYLYQYRFPAAQCNGSVLLQIRQSDATARTIHLGHVQIESYTSNMPNPPFHGSSGKSFAWTGVAHASRSTSAASRWQFPTVLANTINFREGTYLGWVFFNGFVRPGSKYLLHYVVDANNLIYAYMHWGGLLDTRIRRRANGVDAYAIYPAPSLITGWNQLAFCWKENYPLRVNVNGVDIEGSISGEASNNGPPINTLEPMLQTNTFGTGIGIFNRALSPNEIEAMYDLGYPIGLYPRENPTCDEEIFVANKEISANISNMHVYDASGPTWSGNLLHDPLPWSMLPFTVAVGDILYIGCDTTLVDSGPFWNTVFEIGSSGTHTGTWEFYNGAWVAFTVANTYDDTNGLNNTGVRSLAFRETTWITCNLRTLFGGTAPSVTGYWIRYRVTGVTSTDPPVQTTHYPYAVSWGNVETDDDSVIGDLEALARMRITDYDMNGVTSLYIGRRAVNRGEDFRAFLNCADEQMAPGQTVTLVAAGTSYQTDLKSPTGRCVQWVPGGVAAAANIFYITIDAEYAKQYVGVYRVFMRAYHNPLAVIRNKNFAMLAMAFNNLSNEVWYSDRVDTLFEYGSSVTYMGLCDFGVINIPPRGLSMNEMDMGSLYFKLYANDAMTLTHKFYDIILIPYDEMYIQPLFRLENQAILRPGYIGDIDSLTQRALKDQTILSTYPITDQNSIEVLGHTASQNPLMLRQNEQSRYWILNTTLSGAGYPPTRTGTHRVKLDHNTHYFSMRGDR